MTDFVPPEASAQAEPSSGWHPPEAKPQSRIAKLAAPPPKAGIMDRVKAAIIAPKAERDATQAQAWAKGFTGIPAEIGKEFGQAVNAMGGDVMPQNKEEFARDAGPLGPVVPLAQDAAGAVLSPLTGALTSLVGRPVEQATGVRREITGNLLSMLVPGAGEAKAGSVAAKASKAAASVSDLKSAARAAYSVVDNSGMRIAPQAVKDLHATIENDLAAKGFHEKLMPRTQVAVDQIKKVADANTGATLQDIDVLRRIVGHAAGSPDKAERFMGRVVQDHIDDFVGSLDQSKVVGAVDQKAVQSIADARDLWTKASKGEIVENAIAKAKLNSHNFSASGYENALRNQFRKIANNDRAMARFAPDERAAIAHVATGGKLENTLRMAGKFAPHGVVSTALGAGTGFAAGGPAGAVALPVLGEIARQGATLLTARNAARVSEMVRGGDPAGITLLKQFSQIAPKTRALLSGNGLQPVLRRAPAINALRQLSYQGQSQ